ncbi:MAG: YihY/virulence factor BrkB family protein [Armatimonadetes bacterium]|nr:YihY/virulence factor BrkB family protein [Armatimonadota bacterium]
MTDPEPEKLAVRVARAPLRIAVLWLRIARIAYLRFYFTGTHFMAAAVAFYSLICLGPLAVLLAAGLQMLLGPGTDVYERIREAARELGPNAADRIIPMVEGLLANPIGTMGSGDAYGLVGQGNAYLAFAASLVTVIWAAIRLFETLERSLTEVWPGKITRGYLTRKLVAFNSMVVAGLLLGSFMLLNALWASVRTWLLQFPEINPAILDAAQPWFVEAVQILLVWVAFALVYKLMPVQRVPNQAVLAGSLGATVLWLLVSHIFTSIIAQSQQFGTIYGGLTGVVVFSLWSFIGSQTLLFGAHIAVGFEHVMLRRRGLLEDDKLTGVAQRRAERVWLEPSTRRVPGAAVSAACQTPQESREHVDALILAGGSSGRDLAEWTGWGHKALIPILGKPSIAHIIDALRKVPNVQSITIAGPDDLLGEMVGEGKADRLIVERPGLTANLLGAIEDIGTHRRVLVVTCDLPAVTPAALCEFLAHCSGDAELCLPLVSRDSAEMVAPERHWAWLPVKEGWVTHTGVALVRPDAAAEFRGALEQFLVLRRRPWLAASLAGPGFLLRFLVGFVSPRAGTSISALARLLERMTGAARCELMILDRPELAMDLDRPGDERDIEDLLRRLNRPAPPPDNPWEQNQL